MNDEERKHGLWQKLQGWMVFFIVMSVVIGAGIFNNSGTATKIAGPGGALLAFAIMSVIAICVSECISELVQLFPVPNAIVEYAWKFVDEEFGWAIGIAYWLTYSSIFAAQNMITAQLSEYWGGPDPPQVWRIIVFYVVAPVVMFAINIRGVETFGWIESVGGVLKVLLVIATTIILYALAAIEKNDFLQDGFQHNLMFVQNNVSAVCYVLPIMAFGFIGIETIAVTAFEAAPNNLRWPSKYITYITALMYLLCMLSQSLNVGWTNIHLPIAYGGIGEIHKRVTEDPNNPFSRVLAIIAIFNWEQKQLSGVLNGAIIFSVLSASNTTLYVASRTLYGMALQVKNTSPLGKLVQKLSIVDRHTGVPVPALCLSWLSFFWVPFMSSKKDYKVQYVIEIIQTSASVSCLIVWVALCVAYLRLMYWQKWFKLDLCEEHNQDYVQFVRKHENYRAHTVFMSLQPAPAILGVFGCLATFVFCSATFWYNEATFPKVAIAYAAQFIVLIIFLVLKALKIWNMKPKDRRLWPKPQDFRGFVDVLQDFKVLEKESVERAIPLVKIKRKNTSGESAIATTQPAAVHPTTGQTVTVQRTTIE